MPRFYFHTEDHPDSEGAELSDVGVAKCEAMRLAGQIICEEADSFWDKSQWTMTVADESGLILFQLHIIGTEAAAIRGSSFSSMPGPRLA